MFAKIWQLIFLRNIFKILQKFVSLQILQSYQTPRELPLWLLVLQTQKSIYCFMTIWSRRKYAEFSLCLIINLTFPPILLSPRFSGADPIYYFLLPQTTIIFIHLIYFAMKWMKILGNWEASQVMKRRKQSALQVGIQGEI